MAKSSANSNLINKTIYQDIFPKELSKSDIRRIEILRGAILAYSNVDFDHVSYDDVAKPAKTSSRLVQHYFPSKDALFEAAMKMIRAQYQLDTVEAFHKIKDPEKKFFEYIKAALNWPAAQPVHVRAWFLFYLVCSHKAKFKKMHAELALMGAERIKGILGAFIDKPDLELHFIAKTVQRLITGSLIEVCSEQSIPDLERTKNELAKACLLLIKNA